VFLRVRGPTGSLGKLTCKEIVASVGVIRRLHSALLRGERCGMRKGFEIRVAGPNPNTAYTRSRALTSRSNVCVSNPDPTSIRRPLANTTASPPLSLCPVTSRPANSTVSSRPTGLTTWRFLRCLFRCRLSVPQDRPRLRQNSLRRMPLLSNSATNCSTCAGVRRRRTATRCSAFIPSLQHGPPKLEQVCCSNAYNNPAAAPVLIAKEPVLKTLISFN
jgi:hypothetical protein